LHILYFSLRWFASTFKRTHWHCCPGYLLGQTLKRSTTKKKSTTPKTRNRTLSRSAACRVKAWLGFHRCLESSCFRCCLLNYGLDGRCCKTSVILLIRYCNGCCNLISVRLCIHDGMILGSWNCMHNRSSGLVSPGPHRAGIRAILTVGDLS
jgi:hypothetical protein